MHELVVVDEEGNIDKAASIRKVELYNQYQKELDEVRKARRDKQNANFKKFTWVVGIVMILATIVAYIGG